MNRKSFSTLALALAALAAGNALAADSAAPKTRDQVRAELADAQRTGDIAVVTNNNKGKKLNELYPSQYPAKAAGQGHTRAQVLAELAQAQRTGDIVVVTSDNSGEKLNELNPGQYPAKAVAQGNSRVQVLAKLAQAQRSGEIGFGNQHVGR